MVTSFGRRVRAVAQIREPLIERLNRDFAPFQQMVDKGSPGVTQGLLFREELLDIVRLLVFSGIEAPDAGNASANHFKSADWFFMDLHVLRMLSVSH